MLQDQAPSLDYQVLMNIAELCSRQGMEHLILSPGSRSAPLALTFIRHGGFRWRVVPDERSAAYQAVGLASATGKLVGLICTSGTAALNYAPGLAEAYWQCLPLIAFTADRPPEWIGQGENQAIYQKNLFAPNIKESLQIPVDLQSEPDEWHAYQQISNALNRAKAAPNGPVQVNAPFREPLYPSEPLPSPQARIKTFQKSGYQQGLSTVNHAQLTQTLKQTHRILVIAGMGAPTEEELRVLGDFVMRTRGVLVSDFLSNTHRLPSSVLGADLIAKKALEEDLSVLKPELVITLGGPLLSKSLKEFLKKAQPAEHWHIDEAAEARDTFQALTRVIPLKPYTFMRELGGKLWPKQENRFCQAWHYYNQQIKEAINDLATEKGGFSEIRVMKTLLKDLPQQAVLQLGNSMPVRHAQLLGPLFQEREITVKGNRGTSGIDGCLSTAVGYASETSKAVYCILGDMAFMYDRNALWSHSLPPNLTIIILNNKGGGVFRTLPGAKDQPELDSYFTYALPTDFYHTASQHHCSYYLAEDWPTLLDYLKTEEKEQQRPSIIEVNFEDKINFSDISAIQVDLLRRLSHLDPVKNPSKV